MAIENKIQQLFASDKELKKHFLLKPYLLQGKEMVYMEVVSNADAVYLDKILSPLDRMYDALLANGFYFVIFSLNKIFDLTDIPYALTIRMLDALQEKGGRMIFCNASDLILRGMKNVGIDELVEFYASEREMLNKI